MSIPVSDMVDPLHARCRNGFFVKGRWNTSELKAADLIGTLRGATGEGEDEAGEGQAAHKAPPPNETEE